MMGPNTYLPTFGQSVLGLGPIAAGLMLASMSIGGPLASSWSGRRFLRFGFRDTALGGAVLVVLAAAGFLFRPFPDSAWPIVIDQVLLGAGFGLLSTPILVGVQNTVTYRDRGVVTGANIFSRYLGQSLGAALFGAVFNSAMRGELAHAPEALRASLPTDINAVISVLRASALHDQEVQQTADRYLRQAIATATEHVYAGMAVVALITVGIVLLTPRQFPDASEGSGASASEPGTHA
jgi:MFS family permease